MKGINDVVKWICGMGLVLIALFLIFRFAIHYDAAEQDILNGSEVQ